MNFKIDSNKSRLVIFVVLNDEFKKNEKIRNFITVISGILGYKHEIPWEIMVLGKGGLNISVEEKEEIIKLAIEERALDNDVLFIFVGKDESSVSRMKKFNNILKKINGSETLNFVINGSKLKDIVRKAVVRILNSEFKKVPVE